MSDYDDITDGPKDRKLDSSIDSVEQLLRARALLAKTPVATPECRLMADCVSRLEKIIENLAPPQE